jgi:hypothetical protein
MEPYGVGDRIGKLIWETMHHHLALGPLQLPHLQEEPTGNKFLADMNIQQQSKLMEPYGLGGLIMDK